MELDFVHDGHWTHSFCVMEDCSRKIMAAMASVYQDVVVALSKYPGRESLLRDMGREGRRSPTLFYQSQLPNWPCRH